MWVHRPLKIGAIGNRRRGRPQAEPSRASVSWSQAFFCILCAPHRVFVLAGCIQLDGWTQPKYLANFIGGIYSVISFLISVIGFYLYVLAPYLFGALLNAAIASACRRRRNLPHSRGPRDRPVRQPLEESRPNVTVSSVIREMDCRRVILEICFWDRFYDQRIAIAQVRKPRTGESLSTVTFVLCPPSSLWEGETFLARVPDKQLGDFEKVRKGVYRLTSVLYIDDSEEEL